MTSTITLRHFAHSVSASVSPSNSHKLCSKNSSASVFIRLSSLDPLKRSLGEKKFNKRVKKVARFLSGGVKSTSVKAEETKKTSVKKAAKKTAVKKVAKVLTSEKEMKAAPKKEAKVISKKATKTASKK